MSVSFAPTTQLDILNKIDFFRGAPGDQPDADHCHKEWHHFLLHTDTADVLINFNLLHETLATGRQAARVIAIVRTDEWHGGVDYIHPERLRVVPGKVDAQFGRSRLTYRNNQYHVEIDLEDHPIRADLVFTNVSMPGVLRNFPLAPGRAFSWIFVPRLRVNGWIEVDGQQMLFEQALGYHDHNWGSFRWADNFAWEWGSALPTSASSPWSTVLVRATDRGRRSSRCQLLMLWRDDESWCVFQDEDLTFRPTGRFRQPSALKVPSVTALLAGGSAWDVPAQMCIDASRGTDWLTYRFTSKDYSQVVVPNDGAVEGVTALCEVLGDVTIEGQVRGESIHMLGRGVLELVR